MAVLTLVLWVLPGMADSTLWGGLAITMLTAYLIMELNNRNALLRIRSRMMSTTFLFMMLVCPTLHCWHTDALTVLCLIAAYLTLFASYQKYRCEGYIFHAFLFVSMGSMAFPPMLVLALAFYVSMLFQLRNFNWRTFMAGIFGLVLPYWAYAAYAIWNNQLDTAFLYLNEWFTLVMPDYSRFPPNQLATAGGIMFWALLALIHFFRTAYNDKIRTRMLSYVIVTTEFTLAVLLAALPHCLESTMRLFIANTSLLVAHYFALGKGRFFDAWFYLTLLVFAGLGVWNYLALYL